MNKIYKALDIEVLNLSWNPDSTGSIIPPEAEIEFPPTISITYGEDENETKVGTAVLTRKANCISADMTLVVSPGTKDYKTKKMLAKLFPAVGFEVKIYKDDVILKLEIFELFLTTHHNEDVTIKTLGDRVFLRQRAEDLH